MRLSHSPATFITAPTAKSGKKTGAGWKERLPQGHRGSDAPGAHPSGQQTLKRKTDSSFSGYCLLQGADSLPEIVPQVELVIVMQKQSRMKDVPWKLAGSQGAMKVLDKHKPY